MSLIENPSFKIIKMRLEGVASCPSIILEINFVLKMCIWSHKQSVIQNSEVVHSSEATYNCIKIMLKSICTARFGRYIEAGRSSEHLLSKVPL